MSKEVTGRELTSGRSITVTFDGARIIAVDDLGPGDPDEPWLGPGLVDLQVNGFGDIDLNLAPGPERIAELVSKLALVGVTTFCPTVISESPAVMARALAAIAKAIREERSVGESVACIHLEGPFISVEDGPRGAHARRWVRPPDFALLDRLQDAADGHIGIITLSPEWPEAARFIEHCVAAGMVVAIGHTSATGMQIQEAIRAGASLSTHLGNGTHGDLPRHDNYLWEQLAADELWASFIADGAHLPPAVLTTLVRTKGDRGFLVSDTVSVASEPGTYRATIGETVTVTSDRAVRLAADRRFLAGATRPLSDGIAHLVSTGVADLRLAWEMASSRPAKVLGLRPRTLDPGAPADLVRFSVLKDVLRIDTVVARGATTILPAQGASG